MFAQVHLSEFFVFKKKIGVWHIQFLHIHAE